MLNRTLFSYLSPAGQHAKLSIFIFHRVLSVPDPIFPNELDSTRFSEMMGWLKLWFNVLPLDAAVNALKSGKLPRRAAAITFDDGYADNHDIALPILKKHALPATFFIATGFLDGGRMWNDTIIESVRGLKKPELDLEKIQLGKHSVMTTSEKRISIDAIIGKLKYFSGNERVIKTEQIAEIAGIEPPTDLMMTSDQVKEIRNSGMQVGAHTVSHPILARTDFNTVRDEIQRSKLYLEDLLNEPVQTFAYPNGKPGTDFLPEHVKLVEELGFSAAVSTAWGVSSSRSDIFQLPRFTPWDKTKQKFAMRLAANFATKNKF